MDNFNKVLGVLEKIKPDIRDFSHHDLYGTVAPANIPNIDFDVCPLPPIILDQKDLDFCSGFGSSQLNTCQLANISLVDYLNMKSISSSLASRASLAVKYHLVGSIAEYNALAATGTNASVNLNILANLIYDNGDYFDPNYQFSKIKQIRGEYTQWGANIRDAAQALVKYGSIPKNKSPFTYQEGAATDRERNFLANWANWPAALDIDAAKNKLGAFYTPDGPYDAFDNVRSALYLNSKTNQYAGAIIGLNWRPEWTYASGGIIPDVSQPSAGGGHLMFIRGQKIVNGEPMIRFQQSWSKGFGDKGLYYFGRKTFNSEVAAGFGSFVFKKKTLTLQTPNSSLITNVWQAVEEFIKSRLNK